jgi:hypothetical protein
MRLLRGGSLDLLGERPISPQDGSLPGGRLHAAGREGLKGRSLPVEEFALGEAQRRRRADDEGRHSQSVVGAHGPASVVVALSVSEQLPAALLAPCRVAGVSCLAAIGPSRRDDRS